MVETANESFTLERGSNTDSGSQTVNITTSDKKKIT